ncbi:MAG: ThiF family adenylyltransferase [Alphaproteobacteria bacterium]|nr:ThiF family adenylyltransferase [Alphaproteobacteria bacterium]
MPQVSLTLTHSQHAQLRAHLFPGDNLEAVAFLACGRAAGSDRCRLVVRDIHIVPHERCIRLKDSVSWQAEDIELLLDRATVDGLSLVKVHSHPQGYPRFSSIDDDSDAELLPTIRSWVEADVPHGSAVMLPNGEIFGRYCWDEKCFHEFAHVNIVGPDLFFWHSRAGEETADPVFAASQDQAFGEGTTRKLRKLRVAVVGASGTGSPVIEQLIRLGVGEVILIDDDKIEDRNLNRIVYAIASHAAAGREKVFAAKEEIERKGLGTIVTALPTSIGTPEAIRAAASCDVLFGCVDTASARLFMNLIATYYLIPYFDLGILLDAEPKSNGSATIKDILGTVHYLLPGASSLISRGAFSLEDVRTEGLHKRDPIAAAQQVKDKYIKGVEVRRPAVVSVNTFAAALAVNDFLARLHPYRAMPNAEVASIEFSLGQLRLTVDEELEPCPMMSRFVGYGDIKPLLGLPELSE